MLWPRWLPIREPFCSRIARLRREWNRALDEEHLENERKTVIYLRELVRLGREQIKLLNVIARNTSFIPPRLTSVRLTFMAQPPQLPQPAATSPLLIRPSSLSQSDWDSLPPSLQRILSATPNSPQSGAPPMPTAPAPGPLELLVGQTATATLVCLDQNGQPMPAGFVPPAATFTIDQPAIASSTPAADGLSDELVGLADGAATLTATLITAEGLSLQDASGIVVTTPPPPPATLSAIKLEFSTT